MNRPRRYWTPELLAKLLDNSRVCPMAELAELYGMSPSTLYPLIRRAKALQAGRGAEPKLRAQFK